MATYLEQNKTIVGILRVSDEASCHYAADRIEELQAELEHLRATVEQIKARHPVEAKKRLNDMC